MPSNAASQSVQPQLRPCRIWMRRDRHASHPAHVFEHIADFPTERKRRLWKAQCNDVTTVRADFDGVDAEDAVSIDRRVRTTCSIAVVGEDHELQPRAPRRRGDVVNRASAVRSTRVHVNGAADRSARPAASVRQRDR